MILNSTQVKQYLYNSGFRGIDLNAAVNISYCESNFNTNAHNTTGEDSRGLMQINVNAHPYLQYQDLFNPQINTNVAYQIYLDSGKNFSAWTCAKQLNLVKPSNIYFGIALVFIGTIIYVKGV
jgi:hypothetical protein